MAGLLEALGAFSLIVVLAALVLPILFVVGIWRIGTGLKQIGFALNNHPGQHNVAESLEGISQALQRQDERPR